MANEAKRDNNRIPALLAHSDTTDSASALRVTADSLGNLNVSTVQNVVASAVNSSTANVSANSTFTGTSESTLGIAGIQVTLKADQNCRVYIDQSPDGTNWDVSDVYDYNVIRNNFGVTVQAVSSYVRVRVRNLSSSTATTTFRLHTILCPIIEAVPRSLDNYGHFVTHVHGLNDHYGFSGQFTPMRDQKMAQPFRVVGTTFGVTTDTSFWTGTTSGAATSALITNGILTVSSGTSASGYSQFQSVRPARFQFAHPLQFRSLVLIPTVTTANNTKRWGAFSVSPTIVANNGPFFQINSSGALSVNCVSGGTISTVASGSFNGDVSEYVVDTNVHAYEIIYFTAGAWFYIDDVFIHKFIPTTAPLYQNLEVPITFTSVNSSGGSLSGDIQSWNATIMRLGRDLTASTSKYQSGTIASLPLKSGAGVLHNLAISGVSNGSIMTLYDNTTATGTTLFSSGAMGTLTQPFSVDLSGVPFYTGLTLSITSANSNATVIYE